MRRRRRCRRILEGAEPYDKELWRGMAEQGWPGTAIPESHGGAGFGYLELCVIAEELGRSLAPTPFASSVYLATEALLSPGPTRRRRRGCRSSPWARRSAASPSRKARQRPSPKTIATRAKDGRLTGTKLPVADGDIRGPRCRRRAHGRRRR
jgi:alkylation response protein AidB-like acyl-CoA dehydrogenase